MTAASVVLAALAAALVGRPRRFRRTSGPRPRTRSRDAGPDPVLRWRVLWALLATASGPSLLGGTRGVLVGVGVGVVVWVLAARSEPRAVRRRRELARRQLPHVCRLLAAVLRGGAAVPSALAQVARALPGPATSALRDAESRLRVGAPASEVWADLAADPALGPLGRTLARSQATGASVADAVARLADDLARRHRADVEDTARRVGVRAALPLGACLLPAFLLIGIVPVVAGTLTALRW